MTSKTSTLHQMFDELYEHRWKSKGGTLLAFSQSCGVPRETLRGWLKKDRLELLEHLDAAFKSLGAEITIRNTGTMPEPPMDRRRTPISVRKKE